MQVKSIRNFGLDTRAMADMFGAGAAGVNPSGQLDHAKGVFW